MKFKVVTIERDLKGEVIYDSESLAITYQPIPSVRMNYENQASLSVADTLEIWFDLETRRLLYVGGYCPRESWIPASVEVPEFESAGIICEFEDDTEIVSGITYPLPELEGNVMFDSDNSLILIGEPDRAEQRICITEGIIIGLTNEKMCCIWLKLSPSQLQNVARNESLSA